MPTYTNPNDVPYVEAGIHIAAGETKLTPLTLTEMVVTLPAAVSGLGLELVTEASSSETGRIYWIDGARIGLIDLSGVFDGESELTADTTGSLGTPAAGANIVLLTRDIDAEFYSALSHRQEIVMTGAGTEDVYLHRDSRWVVIVVRETSPYTGVQVVIKTSDGDVIMPLTEGQVWQDYNNQRYAHLQLDFASAGTCEVLEFVCDFNPLAFSTL